MDVHDVMLMSYHHRFFVQVTDRDGEKVWTRMED